MMSRPFATVLLLASLFVAGCDQLKTLTEAEQIARSIQQEVKRNERGLDALIAAADNTTYDGFAWRRGERIQIRQRLTEGEQQGELQLLAEAEAPEIIATAVANNLPSFSIVRYQQGWLVVFNTYLTEHCQAVYAYAYRGQLPEVAPCSEERFAETANGQCQSPITANWQLFKEWFFAESLVAEGNPKCISKAEQGWRVSAN